MLDKINDVKVFLVDWNNSFPLDRIWRKKYNIAFCSQQHLDVNQIDVFLDILEDRMFEHYTDTYKKDKERLDNYKKKGEVFVDIVDDEKISQLFDDFDISQINPK